MSGNKEQPENNLFLSLGSTFKFELLQFKDEPNNKNSPGLWEARYQGFLCPLFKPTADGKALSEAPVVTIICM